MLTLKELEEGSVLLINKPKNWSSFDVVKKIRSIIKEKYGIKKIKIGHAGTLDPLAEGLLILCTGKKTKEIINYQNQKKIYCGEITLGGTTPSYDLETKVSMEFNTSHITNAMIIEKAKSFIGKIEQRPPIFSALKQDGERLYKRARRGEVVKIKCREVYVERFDILEINMPKILFKVTCGKGTYIRSIAHDLGKKLNSGAYLSALSRVSIGRYNLEQAIEVCDFDKFLNS
tara:strand:+ start:2149 stop:2841 length:693 start_codon:yes stop_codon:yes gene_type:complete